MISPQQITTAVHYELGPVLRAVERHPLPNPPPPQEMGLRDILTLVWHGKLLIACSTVMLGAVGLGIAYVAPKYYQARVVVSPVARDGHEGALSAALGQLGGLAGLTGITATSGGFRAEALETLQSDILTERYIQENNLLPVLYASKWDAQRHAWNVTSVKDTPTLWQAAQLFDKKIRNVTENSKTGLAVLTITWKDPKLSAKWANDLVAMTNEYMRQSAIEHAYANIDYLTQKATHTNVVEVRSSIYNVMEGELKTAMMAEGDREFALKVLDPAQASEKPFSPQPILWALAAALLGALFSASFVLIRGGRSRLA